MRLLPALFFALPISVQAAPLSIVTDIAPVQSLVLQVTGDRGTVEVLLEPNADPHHFQLRPSQARTIAQSDLVIWISEGLTPWLERARDGVGAGVPNLSLLEEDIHQDTDHEEIAHHHEDPHLWLDTREAIEMLHNIEAKLAELDPEGADEYARNAEAAANRLDTLGGEIDDLLSDVRDIPFAVSHDGYRYFVRQFGLTQAGSLTDIHDSPASAKSVSDLAQMAQDGNLRCVFGEVGESGKLQQVLVEQGAKRGDDLDPAGIALVRGPDLYETLMKNLAQSLENCLRD